MWKDRDGKAEKQTNKRNKRRRPEKATHRHALPRAPVHVPARVDVDPVRDARVDVREDAAVSERLGGGVDVECVSVFGC